jgi:hypothetical protein
VVLQKKSNQIGLIIEIGLIISKNRLGMLSRY